MRLQAIFLLVAMLASFPVCAPGAQFPITVVLRAPRGKGGRAAG